MGLERYFVEKACMYLASMFTAVTLNFIIIRLIPGNPAEVLKELLRQQAVSVGAVKFVEEYIREFGLDKDIPTQFVYYLFQLLHGNLGVSMTRFPVTVQELIARHLPWSIGLLGVSCVISFALGTLLGAFLGWSRNSRIAQVLYYLALYLSLTPYYLLALILVYLFVFLIPLFPFSGGYSISVSGGLNYILDILWHSTLPALSIVLSSAGWWALSMRAFMVNVLGEDFLRLAKAKGLKPARIFRLYALRNAILPQTTGLALSMGNIVAGSLLVEVIFAYPGMGWLLFQAISCLDYNLIQGIFLITVTAVLTSIFIIELLYPLIDPRIRYS